MYPPKQTGCETAPLDNTIPATTPHNDRFSRPARQEK